MKKTKSLLLIICLSGCFAFLNSCSNRNTSDKSDKTLTAEIDQFISQWHKSAAGSDHKAYIDAMAGDGIYIGTDAAEYWTTSAFSAWSKPFFDQKKGWNLVSLNRHIYLGINNETAWFDELLDTGMGLCRGSGVVQKHKGEWKIYHYVLSPTVPNSLINKVKSLKFNEDSLLIHGLRTAMNE
jgi:ketosteroid isomerase-like protein